LYVPGKIAAVDKVLLDVGTGYFIEHDTEKGIDYCKRKVNFIRDNMEKLMELVGKKRKQLLLVQDFLRARTQEAAQAQAGAK
jgi:prefoldin alpha subunit